ncbi:MAG: Nif3-like dinuclear metal center hexameric protein [Pseudomonadota bacterium]|jgi:dinuclear metal center YbgI/SA1388 family protein
MQLKELCDYIQTLLDVGRFRDYCPNGLQVEGRTEVFKLATAVTASKRAIQSAVDWGADVLLVHHGYFWRGEEATLTGIKRGRVALLFQHDLNLLAYHLPLDAHPELGNNAQLAQRFGLIETGRFGEQAIACRGELPEALPLALFAERIESTLSRKPLVIGNPTQSIRRVAWCSGGGQSYFEEAIRLGADVFVTGEISEQSVHLAEESGVAFISAGHHATERYGVQALGAHLSAQFGLQHRFFDQDNPV